jgi:hypothetical protein
VGVSFYERKGWEYEVSLAETMTKVPSFYLTRWGPLLKLTYPAGKKFSLEAAGDLSWVHEWGNQDYTLVNLDIRATWR